MLGTVANTVSILIGGSIGSGLGNSLSKRYSDILLNAISVSVILLGLKSAIKTENVLLVIGCMALGSIIGEYLRIEDRINNIGNIIQNKFLKKHGNIAEGFITATLIYCVGAMSIMGSIESGANNNHSTLFAKSILDGVSAIVFSSTLGIGVSLAAIPVFLYQGLITVLAGTLAKYVQTEALNELSAIGGLLVMIIGLNILKITKIKVGNMVPAVFLPIVYFIVKSYISTI